MKTSQVVLIAILFLVIGIALSNWYNKSKNVCYNLPTEGSPEEWGRYYWRALHSTVDRIPCGICQKEATSFMKFFHDYVNNKKSVALYDKDNFKMWVDKISELKNSQ